jgi:hypothetical protein
LPAANAKRIGISAIAGTFKCAHLSDTSMMMQSMMLFAPGRTIVPVLSI